MRCGGEVAAACQTGAKHAAQNWTLAVSCLDHELPGAICLHLVLDNYGTHKHPNVQAWLLRHPRLVCHYVPTSSNWLHLVERWFGELTSKRIRRGSFGSVAELQ